MCQAPESLALISDDELEWPEGTRVGTKAFVRQALKLAAAAARPEPKMESAAPATGLSLAALVCGVYFFIVAGTAATSDDVVTAFQGSLTEAFGWKSAVKFDFVDIGAELDRHKIRHLFPVEVST